MKFDGLLYALPGLGAIAVLVLLLYSLRPTGSLRRRRLVENLERLSRALAGEFDRGRLLEASPPPGPANPGASFWRGRWKGLPVSISRVAPEGEDGPAWHVYLLERPVAGIVGAEAGFTWAQPGEPGVFSFASREFSIRCGDALRPAMESFLRTSETGRMAVLLLAFLLPKRCAGGAFPGTFRGVAITRQGVWAANGGGVEPCLLYRPGLAVDQIEGIFATLYEIHKALAVPVAPIAGGPGPGMIPGAAPDGRLPG